MTGTDPKSDAGPRPLRLTAKVRRGLALLLGDEDVSGDQQADEVALARARAWMRDVMQRSAAGREPRVRPRGPA